MYPAENCNTFLVEILTSTLSHYTFFVETIIADGTLPNKRTFWGMSIWISRLHWITILM